MQGCTPLFYGIRAVNNSENISAAFLSHSSASELELYLQLCPHDKDPIH